MDTAALRERIEEEVRALDLIPRGGAVTCLVSGGADSTCLWHALGALGYTVSAVHVDHGLRGTESDEDAHFCRDALGAQVVEAHGPGSEAELRERRYRLTTGQPLRATGHTRSDQVETVLYHLVSRGHAKGIEPKRADGVVRPLLPVTREETRAYCEREGVPFREDTSNPDTKRGLIREQILPLLRELHPAAEENLLRLLDPRETLSPELAELLAARIGSKRVDLGGGVQAVREYDRLWLEHGPKPLRGRVRWGEWTIESQLPNLHVRAWRAGDRLEGRRRKVQDVFVDAKVPRSERESWPLVVRGDEVVAIPGLVEVEGVKAERA